MCVLQYIFNVLQYIRNVQYTKYGEINQSRLSEEATTSQVRIICWCWPLKTKNMCFYIAKKVNVLEHTRWVRFSTLERYCSSFHFLMIYILLCTAVHCTFKILHCISMFYIVQCTAVHCTFNIVQDKSSTVHFLVHCLHNSMYCGTFIV